MTFEEWLKKVGGYKIAQVKRTPSTLFVLTLFYAHNFGLDTYEWLDLFHKLKAKRDKNDL